MAEHRRGDPGAGGACIDIGLFHHASGDVPDVRPPVLGPAHQLESQARPAHGPGDQQPRGSCRLCAAWPHRRLLAAHSLGPITVGDGPKWPPTAPACGYNVY